MELVVTELPRNRIKEALDLLCREFLDDPALVSWSLSAETRDKINHIILGDAIRFYQRFGTVWVALLDGEIVGVAVCVPPDLGAKRSLDYRVRNRLRGYITRARLVSVAQDASRRLFEGYVKAEKIHPKEPHWYPMFVAVDRRYQNRGYGAQLLKPMLDDADRRGLLTFSESPMPRNHSFFRKLGFTIGAPADLFRGAPPNYAMYRPAGSRGGQA